MTTTQNSLAQFPTSIGAILSAVCTAENNLSMNAIKLANVSEETCSVQTAQNTSLLNATDKQAKASVVMGFISLGLTLTATCLGVAGGLGGSLGKDGSLLATFGHVYADAAEIVHPAIEGVNKGLETGNELSSAMRETRIEQNSVATEVMGSSNDSVSEMFRESFSNESEMASKSIEVINADRKAKSYDLNA